MKLKDSNRSRSSKEISKTTSRSVYKKYLIKTDPYWDEGIMTYPRKNKGTKSSNKKLMRYKQRMYLTWKHNRKTQYQRYFK